MRKLLIVLENIFLISIIFISIFIFVIFIYHINNEKVDTSYLWNVSFSEPKVSSESKKGTIKKENDNVSLEVTLEKEEEFYEFTIDVENKGNLKAKISEINKNIESTNNVLVASITYLDGKPIKKGDILESKEKKVIKVKILYPKQKNKIYDSLTLKLNFSIKYVPA